MDARVDAQARLRALEEAIETGQASEQDRVDAYRAVRDSPDDGSAEYAFARAALAGRVAELRGVRAGKLVTEAETYARLTLERDPDFHQGDATRMLGTLYVLAPGRLVEHGDAEDGLELLEDLVEARPHDPRNHLRVAEAYLALDDPEPAYAHLCAAAAKRDELRRSDRALLDNLVENVGTRASLGCD